MATEPRPFRYRPYTAAGIAAQVASAEVRSREVLGICLHHSADPSQADTRGWSDEKIVRSIYNGHTNEPPGGRGWRDIGYHYVICPSGIIAACRPLWDTGGHALNWNDDTVGVCLIGSFDTGDEKPTAAQTAACGALLRALAARYKIDLARDFERGGRGLGFHRDEPDGRRQGKTCPGTGVTKALVRAWVAQRPPDPEAEAAPDDDRDVAPWAEAAVARVQAAGIMQGRGGGRFEGAAPCTRQELAVVVDRLLQRMNEA